MSSLVGTRSKNRTSACGNVLGPPLLLKVDQVAALLAISRRTVWKLVSEGKLSKPVYVTRAARWRYTEILKYVEDL